MNVVILAAGMGKRMQSALPKVLHPLAGKPLLQHVIDTARGLSPSKLCVIYGHGGAAVPEMVARLAESGQAPIDTALQQPQLGTGHGERETSYVSNTSFERRSSLPDEVITIRYDSRQNLIAAGIITNPVQQPVPRPFPESVRYTPDPPAWR